MAIIYLLATLFVTYIVVVFAIHVVGWLVLALIAAVGYHLPHKPTIRKRKLKF